MRRPESDRPGGWPVARRPGALAGVVALHALLVLALWQSLRSRELEVRVEPHALVWVNALPARPTRAAAPPAKPPPQRVAVPSRPPAPARPPAALAPHESTWVEPAPAVAAAPAASAASSPPTERLLDSAATRAAIRQTGRMPLLQERAAAAAADGIARTDAGLAGGVAAAGMPDCMKDPVPGGILGIPLLAVQVARGKCAK